MAYGGFKDLIRRTASNKILHDKAFNIAKNPKYDGYQRGLASMVFKFFDKKSASLAQSETLATRDKNGNMFNQELSEELHKPNITKFEKRKVYSAFIENIWCADLADIQLISKFNKGIWFLL